MKRLPLILTLVSLLFTSTVGSVLAQDPAPSAAPVPAAAALERTDAAPAPSNSGGFWAVVIGSGFLGILLWLCLFGSAGFGVYFVVDCAITVRVKRVLPQALVDNVTAAMLEGDVLKALEACEKEPGALANVLTAGFSHVEEGYEVIQDAVSTAADIETEKIMQKLTWLSVCANIAPMLGLLGTVQGMIWCFANLATGAPDIGSLALSIAQALYTTAAGLSVAIPCVTLYYTFRNKANMLILRMESMTLELIKDLRNVEVVNE
jgi:biopolymer transport protein ExbB